MAVLSRCGLATFYVCVIKWDPELVSSWLSTPLDKLLYHCF